VVAGDCKASSGDKAERSRVEQGMFKSERWQGSKMGDVFSYHAHTWGKGDRKIVGDSKPQWPRSKRWLA
jgi:hypothetical protein